MGFNKLMGDKGESFACNFLKKKKMKILERNFQTALGEIDIIARDKNEIVFVEVKTRSSNKFGEPKESVNEHKQNTIRKVAKIYLKKKNLLDEVNVRFDCVALWAIDENDFEVEHFEGAF